MQGELTAIRSSLEEQQNDMELMRDQMEERAGQEAEFEELRAEVARLISAEEALQARLSGRDRKIVHLEEKLTDMADTRQRRMEAVSLSNHVCYVRQLGTIVADSSLAC